MKTKKKWKQIKKQNKNIENEYKQKYNIIFNNIYIYRYISN